MIIGIDTGGTFTDLIYITPQGLEVHKLPSTPHNPAEAVLHGLRALPRAEQRSIIHGSTVATNAVLERKGVATALIGNRGFEDVVEIGRQNRSRLYDLHYRRPEPPVPAHLRFGIPGRIRHTGEEHEPFDEQAALEVVERILGAGVESVAVSLLFSFANPAHERRMAELLRARGLAVSVSHEILAEFREYERTSTTVVNAYVAPKMMRYIRHLTDHLQPDDSLRIMQSNGGSISAETASKESVKTILSGPAGGVVGAGAIGKAAGFENLLTFDMGGTSTDVSLIAGRPTMTVEALIAGFPLKTPMLDIHTVGAGGGSIAAMEAGSVLKVGPQSAGADPGPICYGKGDRITVTDANLLLGRLIPDHFLGGSMRLHPERLKKPFQALAKELGLSPQETAEGIIGVADVNMERALRVISVEKGLDPREFTLFSFGGAGGLHAVSLARMLRIPMVLVPQNPGILSAMGMLLADVVKDYSATVMLKSHETSPDALAGLFAPLEETARADMDGEGIRPEDIIFEHRLDMRYQGQSYEIFVDFGPNYIRAFHELHERTYGYRNPEKTTEVVNIRLTARGLPEKPPLQPMPLQGKAPPTEALLMQYDTVHSGKTTRADVYRRDALRPGNILSGPAVLVEYSSTTWLPPLSSARVDAFGNLIITADTSREVPA